jgi:hypothetical protein
LEVQLLDAVGELLVVKLELKTRDLGNVQQTLVHPTIKLLSEGTKQPFGDVEDDRTKETCE